MKSQAGNKPRLLHRNGIDGHESLEILGTCYENNNIFCQLPFHGAGKDLRDFRE